MPLLLTGFPEFLPALETFFVGNSSQNMVEYFSSSPPPFLGELEADFNEVAKDVRTAILPVKSGGASAPGTSARTLRDLLQTSKPDGVVCMGHLLAFHAHLELVANRPAGLKVGDPQKRSWFADRVADEAKKMGMAVTCRSLAVGTCNDTYWTAMEWAGKDKPAAFIHLPPYIRQDREAQLFRQVLFVLKKALELGNS